MTKRTVSKARLRDSYAVFSETDVHSRCSMPHSQHRVNRVPTMHSLISGGQKQEPHTIPFSLIHDFCFNCTVEQLKNLVLSPRKFQELMERIFSGNIWKKFEVIHIDKKCIVIYTDNTNRKGDVICVLF